MLPLKIVLYIVCFLSLLWTAVIFAGPAFIKKIISVNSNGQITASSIVITPKLDLEIGRLEYAFRDSEDRVYREGFSRSVNIVWSFLGEEPLVKAQFGPTLFKDTFFAESFIIYTPSFSEIDLKEISLKAIINDFEMLSVAFSKRINLEATYVKNKDLLSKVFVTISEGDLNSWLLTDVSVNVDKINLKSPLDKQEINIGIFTEILENKKLNLRVLGSEGSFNVEDSRVRFDYVVNDIFLSYSGYKLEGMELVSEGKINKKGYLENARAELFERSNKGERKPIILFNLFSRSPGRYYSNLKTHIEQIELTLGENFVGNLPASNLDLTLDIDSKIPQVDMTSEITFENLEIPKISGEGVLSIKLPASEKISDCYFIYCNFNLLSFDYKISAYDEWVMGVSACSSKPCSFLTMQHWLRTSNTNELFRILDHSKVISPLYMAYIYALITSGEKLEDGHKILLN